MSTRGTIKPRPFGGYLTGAGVLTVAILLSGCSGVTNLAGVSNAAPPLVVCGHQLYSGAAAVIPYQVRSGTSLSIAAPVGQELIVQVSGSCLFGATTIIQPAGVLRVDREVKARDARPVAFALEGVHAGTATLTVGAGRGVSGSIRITVS